MANLRKDVITCEKCPRLRSYCQSIGRKKKRATIEDEYWTKPVPDFGQAHGQLLIVGLAPAAHGANRTGRMFTGDRSGQWLYRALHRANFANQATYERADDGLALHGCAITAAVRCAPPDNRPSPDEIEACAPFLGRSIELHKPRVIVALGAIAWRSVFHYLRKERRWSEALPKFSHGHEVCIHSDLWPDLWVIASYHPSQQNTFTGRLTESAFDAIFSRARSQLCD